MSDSSSKADKLTFPWILIKYLGIFIIGAVGYGVMEVIWRGYTHYSMLIAGGLVLCGAYLIIKYHWGASFFLRCIAVTALIITVELVFGLIFNMILGQGVWDYSKMAFNFHGQICASYSLLWLLVSVIICAGLDIYRKISDGKQKETPS